MPDLLFHDVIVEPLIAQCKACARFYWACNAHLGGLTACATVRRTAPSVIVPSGQAAAIHGGNRCSRHPWDSGEHGSGVGEGGERGKL